MTPRQRTYTFTLLALAVFLAAGLWVRGRYYYPIVNKNSAGENIIALGDSLTYGTGANRDEAWPALVSERCGCTIINKGVPGDTTDDALQRLERDVVALNPRMVIVALGGNDMLQRQPQENMFQNLRQIIGTVQAAGSMVVVVGLNGFPLDQGLGSEYRRLARETGSVYVPNILGGIFTNPKMKSDQIHPNAAGYEIMADRIYAAIKPYL
jgi:lysophospholipase L1-like esterase